MSTRQQGYWRESSCIRDIELEMAARRVLLLKAWKKFFRTKVEDFHFVADLLLGLLAIVARSEGVVG